MRKWLLALAFSVFAIPAAHAEDFTLTVPVNVSGLPANVHTVWVTCQVMESSRSRITAVAGQRIAITGGAYRADVVLTANASAGRDPSLATQYRCVAWFFGAVAGDPQQAYFMEGSPHATHVFPLAPGAAFLLDTGDTPLR
ncbi:hypothetical protein [Terricaulis silvestris]|uniref:Secreted protein n=1 Tax=Terricaulis silvestris TaxID=2686094 RepID=A0A6I6MQG1_9CAUL|nr:hypothetical protein [Terricaulis silvestris]QGZ96401.1 hypothetical protein DSM104635_03260 [Terricaulis silvestris]